MNLVNLLKKFHLEKANLNLKAAEVDVSFQEDDKDAVWDLYVEMLTRIVTQPLPAKASGATEILALKSEAIKRKSSYRQVVYSR